MTKCIVIVAYSRPDLMIKCKESIESALEQSQWKKILVWQKGIAETELAVSQISSFFDLVITTQPRSSVLGSINFNRILGTEIAFKFFDSEIVLGIEEDTVISRDALLFIRKIHQRYGDTPQYRGINLGSQEPYSIRLANTYSLIRYGIIGQAGVLSKETWRKFKLEKLLENSEVEGWDSRLEQVLKTGFMVTSNCSRSLDRGWDGTHAPTDSSDKYFTRMEESWIGDFAVEDGNFEHTQIKHNWRSDSIEYKNWQNILFRMRINRYLYSAVRNSHIFRIIKNQIYSNKLFHFNKK
jgi:hypothetical protein